MYSLITDIQRFSIHDGPGIRTTVFLKGCPLSCFWCHNPETQSPGRDIFLQKRLCIHCGKCMKVCPDNCITLDAIGVRWKGEKCRYCGKCTDICPTGAIKQVGHKMSPQEVLEAVRADEAFYEESGGGITFSGGEPMLHIDFLVEALRLCKEEGYHTAVDTSGYFKQASIDRVLTYTDLFLYDIKAGSEETYRRGTGKEFKIIHSNLMYLSQKNVPIYIRIPIIPGYNDNEKEMCLIAEILRPVTKAVEVVELLPFHRMGSPKYAALNREYKAGDLKPPSRRQMEDLAKKIFSVHERVEIR